MNKTKWIKVSAHLCLSVYETLLTLCHKKLSTMVWGKEVESCLHKIITKYFSEKRITYGDEAFQSSGSALDLFAVNVR